MSKLRCLSPARRRAAWIPVLGLAALSGGACERSAWPAPQATRLEARDAPAAPERVRVFYPRGDCTSGQIEVQVHQDGRWRLHPEHPIVGTDSEHWEQAEDLLSLRVRCSDPASRRPPSAWVLGVHVGGGLESPDAPVEAEP